MELKSYFPFTRNKTSSTYPLFRHDCPVVLKVDHISRINNNCADKISQVYSKTNLYPSFESLFQEYPLLTEKIYFNPIPELLSDLYSVLIERLVHKSSSRKNLGHFTLEKNITKNS